MTDDQARLAALYRDVGPGVLAYLRRSFGDPDSAEDLLHETFLHAARRMERLHQVVSPRAWLFAIARNVAITALRRRRVSSALPDELAAPEAEEDPRRVRVRGALSQLPPGQREALELRLRDELSYEEIAEVLQVPVGTVRSRLHYALQQLRVAASAAENPPRGVLWMPRRWNDC